jgi:predicted RNase H-like HicB family nuclease
MMHYAVVVHKDKDSDFGVSVPDLPGCYSAGRTVDEALRMAREAIELHLEGIIEGGGVIPRPTGIDQVRARSEFADGVWALVAIDTDTLRDNIIRLNITMPERVLDAVDRFAAEHGETRSGLLAQAAVAYMRKKDSTAQRRPLNMRKRRKPATRRTKR